MTHAREAEFRYIIEQNELEITKARDLSAIETKKFSDMTNAIGSDTIAALLVQRCR